MDISLFQHIQFGKLLFGHLLGLNDEEILKCFRSPFMSVGALT